MITFGLALDHFFRPFCTQIVHYFGCIYTVLCLQTEYTGIANAVCTGNSSSDKTSWFSVTMSMQTICSHVLSTYVTRLCIKTYVCTPFSTAPMLMLSPQQKIALTSCCFLLGLSPRTFPKCVPWKCLDRGLAAAQESSML